MGKSKIALTSLILTLVLSSCGVLGTAAHPPLVFALNLSSQTVSVELVHDSLVSTEFKSLLPMESRPLVKVDAETKVVLRQSSSDASGWSEWTDPSGLPYSFDLRAGHSYSIVINAEGKAAFYEQSETYSNDPKLCVVNVTLANLSQVQAAPAWAKNVKMYTQDVVPEIPSEFYSVPERTLGLYWQTIDQVATGEFKTALGLDGSPLRMKFEIGRTYLFLAGNGAVRDITPKLD